jgi:putative transposase
MSKQGFYTINSGIFQELLLLIGKMVHSQLVRQIEYLKVENQILRKKVGKRIKITPSERRRLIKFALPLGSDIRKFISIVTYSSFRRWLRIEFGASRKYSKRGRPKTSKEIQDIVLRLAKENNWGYTRILAELKKLRIYRLSRNTIKNILKEHGLDPAPKRSEDTWDSFIKRHFKTLWACDFFTKTVWTALGPKTFHALFFINVHTRRVHIAGITKHPTHEWVNTRARTVSFLFKDDNKSKLLMRDGDTKYSSQFDNIFKQSNVNVKKIPYRSPNLNPYAEGWVGTIKRECLDHFFVFGERHFRYLVLEYVRYYNTKRPHPGLGYKMPINTRGAPTKTTGRLRCEETLGGLAKHYYWS